MKKLLILLITMLLFVSCAELDSGLALAPFKQEPYVWYQGFLHGLMLPIATVARIFNDNWVIYSANNTGVWYDVWFYLGSVSGAVYRYTTKNNN